MKAIKDEELRRLIVKKNEVALKYIIEEYGKLVKFIIKKQIKDERIVEECISDVFLSIWLNISKFDPKKNTLKNWIASISRYKAIDYYRKVSRDKIISIDQVKEIKENSSEDMYSVLYRGIHELVDGLNEEEKEIVIMRFEKDLKPSEIAEITGKNIKYIYNKIDRSKKTIKAKYLKEGGK